MPQTSSDVEARLSALAKAVETDETGLRVVAARPAALPYADLEATVEILEARQLNILEAFILRAAHELEPLPTLAELAVMLGLDLLFVEASWQQLAQMGAVTLAGDGKPQLTELGRDYYLQGQLPPAASTEELPVRYWAVSDQLVISEGELPPTEAASLPTFPGFIAQSVLELEAAAGRALQDLDGLVAATEEVGLGLHQPEDGQTISAVSMWQVTGLGTAGCAILVVQETLATGGDEDTIMLRVVDFDSGQRHFDAEAVLRRWIAEGRVTLKDLLAEKGTGDGD